MANDIKFLRNKGRTSIQGQALYVRSARQTARTIEVRAVLRHSIPNKGLHPLRRYAAIPADFVSGAAIESVAPLTKVLTETEFYSLAEKALAAPEVKGLLMEAVNEHNQAEQKERC